jgi:excisionase family DNA binding protein
MALAEEKGGEKGGISSSERGRKDVLDLYSKIRDVDAEFIGSDGKVQSLPSDLSSFLARILVELKAKKAVSILHGDKDLTTAGSAQLLGVSRQFLVRLLEQGQIPFHHVGTHRRVYIRDVLAYRSARDNARSRILTELAQAEMKDGLYDLVPLNDSH